MVHNEKSKDQCQDIRPLTHLYKSPDKGPGSMESRFVMISKVRSQERSGSG